MKFRGAIIGLDMDGVIVDNTRNKIKLAKKLGFHLKPEDTPADFIVKLLPADALAEIRELLYHKPKTALEAELVPGAKIGLEKLKKSELKYFLISRRPNPDLAKNILEKLGVWPKYLNDQNAFFVNKPEEKNEKAIELGVNIYVDDQPSVLEKLTSVPNRFLFDRFGKFDELPFKHIKISSWGQFLYHLDKIKYN